MRIGIIQIALFIAWPFCGTAQQKLSLSDTIPLNSAVRHGVLENGLSYYILKNANPPRTIELSLIEKAGVYHEGAGEAGLAHFIEHLGYRSTVNFPAGLRKVMMSLGLKPGSEFGATTGNTTTYQLTIPGEDSLMLRCGLLALHDWAKGMRFIPEEVEEERSAIMNENARGNTKDVFSKMEANYLLLDKHPLYGLQKEAENIKDVSIEALIRFYRKWYQPDQQAVVIVGDIDEAEMERKVRTIFSTLTKDRDNNNERSVNVYKAHDVPLTGKNKLIVVGHGPGDSKIHVEVLKKKKNEINIGGPATVGEFKIKLMDELYNALMKNRLDLLTLESNRKLPYLVHNINRRAISDLAGIDAMITYVDLENVTEAKAVIQFAMTELHRVAQWGFTPGEFARSKEAVKANVMRRLYAQTSKSLGLSLVRHFVSKSAVPANAIELNNRLLDEISLVEINAMAKDWLSAEANTDVLMSVPNENDPDLPSEQEVFSWIKETRNASVMPYAEREVKSLPKPPLNKSGGFTTSECKETDIIKLELHNGIQVILKRLGPPRETGQTWNEVVLHGFSPGGANLYRERDYPTASIAASLVTYAGLGSLDRFALMEWINDKNRNGYLSAAPYIDDDEEGITGASSLNNYEALLQLVYLYTVKPRKDFAAFNDWLKTTRQENLRKRSGAMRLADSIQSLVDGKASMLTDVWLKKVRVSRAFDIYKERFANPSDFTFVIAGYFDNHDIIERTVCYLGAIPRSTLKKEVAVAPSQSFKNTDDLRVTMLGDSTGNVHVRMLFSGSGVSTYEDYLKLEILNEALRAILFERLREKEKATYDVGARLRSVKRQERYSFDIGFETAPADVDRAVVAVIDEISTLSKTGMRQGVFNNAVAIVRKKVQREMENTSYWVDSLVESLRKHENPLEIMKRLETLDKITSSEVQHAAREFVDFNHYSLFKLF